MRTRSFAIDARIRASLPPAAQTTAARCPGWFGRGHNQGAWRSRGDTPQSLPPRAQVPPAQRQALYEHRDSAAHGERFPAASAPPHSNGPPSADPGQNQWLPGSSYQPAKITGTTRITSKTEPTTGGPPVPLIKESFSAFFALWVLQF